MPRGRAASLLAAGVAVALAALVVGIGPRLAEAAVAAAGIVDPAAGEALFTLLVFGTLALVALAGGAASGVAVAAPGARFGSRLAQGAAIGVGAIGLAIAMAGVAGTVHVAHRHGVIGVGTLALGVLVVAGQVAAEELFFRGWLQPLVARALGLPAGVAIAAVAFGLLHLFAGAATPLSLANMIAGGLLFGTFAARGGGIAAAIGAHGGWNLVEQLGVGLDPNPGLGSFGAFADWDLVGAAGWGGSPEGLNASWAMLAALLAVLVPLLILAWRPPPAPAAHRSAPARA